MMTYQYLIRKLMNQIITLLLINNYKYNIIFISITIYKIFYKYILYTIYTQM